MSQKKVLIFGLDCATPQLVFSRWQKELPSITALMDKGFYGPLKSCIPPITIPAWTCMMTGKNPGRLGCYGFRNRSDFSYNGLSFATSKTVQGDTVWDILSRHKKKVILVGVPQTYPPKPVNGVMVTCFLTPDTTCQYTYPIALKDEIHKVIGEYILDVEHFRTEKKQYLLQQIYMMTEKRFALFDYFLKNKPWDFAMMVEMGIDRIHHGFWKFMDKDHPKYEPGNPYEHEILKYYKFVDKKIGSILKNIKEDTTVLIVSDHGAQAMMGGVCINEWLIKEGYLSLAETPVHAMPLHKVKVDWDRTMAWGEGGYYCRIFLNVKEREPQGIIAQHNYEKVRNELKEKLEAMPDDKGNNLGTRVFKPEEIYPQVNGIAPDLIVYPGNLKWRSVGSVGLNTIYTFENDIGPDDANHAEDGIFICFNPGSHQSASHRMLKGLHIVDIAPNVLNMLGITVPEDMEGTLRL